MKALFGILGAVAVVVVVVIALQPGPDPPPVTPTASTVTQPQPAPTPPPTEGVRRVRIDTWTWDANSITLTVTNTGDVYVSGTAQCRVDFGVSGSMWPQMPLHGLQPGESWTQTYSGLWAAGNVPTLVPECVVISP